MQPGVAGGLSTEAETAPRRRAHGISVQPLLRAAGEGAGLGLAARQSAIELGDARPLVEEDIPILGRPAVIGREGRSVLAGRCYCRLLDRAGIRQVRRWQKFLPRRAKFARTGSHGQAVGFHDFRLFGA
jgi:hypothetical protein